MNYKMCEGIDTENRRRLKEKYDDAIKTMIELTESFDGHGKIQSSMKHVIADLTITKEELNGK